ncbi:hypothetical protein [Bradyrhizobium ivorense]|uniref:hypothetical protein n=1 Tax=Bradyrhizobium ivorense TaxID=2511166 RepID=UPI0011160349|nr:hypothetical protein [Bradyrhizobium ivorense]
MFSIGQQPAQPDRRRVAFEQRQALALQPIEVVAHDGAAHLRSFRRTAGDARSATDLLFLLTIDSCNQLENNAHVRLHARLS